MTLGRFALGLLSLVSVGSPVLLHAQRVRGTVREDASGQPLPGAVIAVINASATTTARTISNGAGTFTLAVTPQSVRLHVIRIGYVPRDVTLGPGDSVITVSLSRIPTTLGVVHVASDELCPGTGGQGQAFQLWEQARAGLLASIVSREANPAEIQTLLFDRTLDAPSGIVRRETARRRQGSASNPFVASGKPSVFAEHGYMAEDATGTRTFSAPDERVLLDESFAATHCFHLEASDAGHRGQVGLAFTPVPGRDTVVDVRGVIWMYANPLGISQVEFKYTNLEPAAERADAGGIIDFRGMPNGALFVDYWKLHLPELAPGSGGRADERVADVSESGGEVLHATWRDGTAWNAPVTGVTGAIVQRGSSQPAPFAIVTFDGTPDSTVADSAGRFTLAPVVDGRYQLVATDTSLESFGDARTASQTVTVGRDSLTPAKVVLEPIAAVIERICRGQRRIEHTTALLGHVALAGGGSAAGGMVVATWQANFTGTIGGDVTIDAAVMRSTVDSRGRFAICGVAIDRPVKLRFTLGDQAADTTVKAHETTRVTIDWRPRLAARALTVTVKDATSAAPLMGAEIRVDSLRQFVRTGEAGEAVIDGVSPGRRRLTIRRLGYAALDTIVTVGGGTAHVTVPLTPIPAVLEAMSTNAGVVTTRLQDFERRRSMGIGHFLGDSVLWSERGRSLASVLANRLPGLRLAPIPPPPKSAPVERDDMLSYGRMRLVATQMDGILHDGQPFCMVDVYLDRLYFTDDVESIPTSDIIGAELYDMASAPPEFRRLGKACKVLVLWTR